MTLTSKQQLQSIYQYSWDYLLNMLPETMKEHDLIQYFQGDVKDFNTLSEVFERLIYSAQNYQSMPNVIKFDSRYTGIKDVLYDFNYLEVKNISDLDLYYKLRETFKITSVDSKHNSWLKWSKSIIDAATFISKFNDVEDFKCFVAKFDYNAQTRIALPLLIEKKVRGVGFALACDFLKELGYLEYAKPDVHLIKVFVELGMSDNAAIDVFESIVLMSDACKELDESITPYKIDKVIWLICSGKFYLNDIEIGGQREKFIEHVSNLIHIN